MARPTKLYIHRIRRDEEPSYSAVSELRWMQAWQRQQRFQNVQEFSMAEDISLYESNPHTTFAQSMVTYAGFWNLQKCDLAGPFCLFSAVGSLPTTLQSLSLHPDYGPREIASSAFQRFSQLEFLTLAWSADDFPCNFVLDCTLDSLCTLDLSGTYDINVIPSCAPNCNIGACLPNISTFRGRVGSGEEGEYIACSLAVSKHLQELELVLVDPWDNTTYVEGLGLRGNPRLVIASTELLTELRTRLKEIGVSYRLFSFSDGKMM